MKRVVILLSLILFLLIPKNISYGILQERDYLDIKIEKSLNLKENITLHSEEGFVISPKENKEEELHLIILPSITISYEQGEMSIKDLEGNLLYRIPSDGSIVIGPNTQGNLIINVGKIRYRDYITFVVKDKEIMVINHIYIEHYLYGVIPKEMPPSFPVEALKAQSIAARNYALRGRDRHKNMGFDLCDTTHCQVYGGLEVERPSTNLAVDETKNIYAYYNGELIQALYSSTSGGQTEDNKNVNGTDISYLVGVQDIYSINSPYSTWSYKLTLADINSRLKERNINIGDLVDIEILDYTNNNRINRIKLIGTSKEEIISGNKLREVIGYTNLKSTWFSLNKEGTGSSNNKVYAISGSEGIKKEINLRTSHILDGKNFLRPNRSIVSRAMGQDRTREINGALVSTDVVFTFEGKGYGHGVGMSQWGAKEMADLGFNYEDILKHYYRGIDIVKLDN